MRMISSIVTVFSVMLFTAAHSYADELPIREREPRKFFAHYMGCFPVGTRAIEWHAGQQHNVLMRDLTQNDGYPGNTCRNYGFTPRDRRLSLEESADLEIKRAMRIGVDGFAVDAWAGGHDAVEVLETMFAVAEENEYDFELTVCIDPVCPILEDEWLPNAEKTIKWLLDNYGDHPNLARRDGRPVIFGYMSRLHARPHYRSLLREVMREELRDENLEDDEFEERVRSAEQNRLRTPWGWEAVAEFWGPIIEERVGEPLYIHYCMFNSGFFQRTPHSRFNPEAVVESVRTMLQEVDAISFFIDYWGRGEPLDLVAETVIEAGGEWGQPLVLQYENYVSGHMWASTGLDWIRRDFERARKWPSTLIQYITWNDYGENTILAPGWNTRYAFYDIMGYFIDWWKNDEEPEIERDKLYIFSRKYPKGAETYPFQTRNWMDGKIEILTLLTEPAVVRVPNRGENGEDAVWEAPAGMSYRQFDITPGTVSAEVSRDGEIVLSLEHPEPITDRPFRQDIGITAISTECERLWKEDFGEDVPFFRFTEYGDDDGDGLPNWFEMLYFGKFGDMKTSTNADPDEDASGDGLTNLEAYRQRVHPVNLQD